MSEPHPDEEERNRAYKVGISVGLDQASHLLMDKSVSAFKRGDAMAVELRKLSIELKRLSDGAHPGTRKP